MQQKTNSDNVAASAKGCLIYADGKLRGTTIPIHSGRNDVGRREGDIQLPEAAGVSMRKHCVINYDEDKKEFSIIPENKVRVNGKLVLKSSLLKDFDRICIGETNLIFKCQSAVNYGMEVYRNCVQTAGINNSGRPVLLKKMGRINDSDYEIVHGIEQVLYDKNIAILKNNVLMEGKCIAMPLGCFETLSDVLKWEHEWLYDRANNGYISYVEAMALTYLFNNRDVHKIVIFCVVRNDLTDMGIAEISDGLVNILYQTERTDLGGDNFDIQKLCTMINHTVQSSCADPNTIDAVIFSDTFDISHIIVGAVRKLFKRNNLDVPRMIEGIVAGAAIWAGVRSGKAACKDISMRIGKQKMHLAEDNGEPTNLRNRYLLGQRGEGYDLFRKVHVDVHTYDKECMVGNLLNNAQRENGACIDFLPDFPSPDVLEAYLRSILLNVADMAKFGGQCDITKIVDCFIIYDRRYMLTDYFNTNNSKAYIITDHIDGTGLADYMGMDNCIKMVVQDDGKPVVKQRRFDKLDIHNCIEMMMPLMDSIICGHAKGIVYEDICMENLVVVQDNGKPVVKRRSFGKCADAPERVTWLYEKEYGKEGHADSWANVERYVKEGNSIVKKRMQPDKREGEIAPYIGPWTDVYMLAYVICQCLTGKDKPSIPSPLYHYGLCAGNSSEEMLADISDNKMREVLIKALQPQIEDRIQTMEEFKTALERILAGSSGIPAMRRSRRRRRGLRVL